MAITIDVDDLKNCMMASSMMNIDFDNFNWRNKSGWLCEKYGDTFDSWWDKSRFNYNSGTPQLIEHCSYHFFRWWDPYRIKLDTTNRQLLCKHCSKHFEVWWTKPHGGNVSMMWYELMEHCNEHFKLWWDADIFPWHRYRDLLKEHCADNQHIWGQDYIIYQLHSEEDAKVRWNRRF